MVHDESVWLYRTWSTEGMLGRLDDESNVFGADRSITPLRIAGVRQLSGSVNIPRETGLCPLRAVEMYHNSIAVKWTSAEQLEGE